MKINLLQFIVEIHKDSSFLDKNFRTIFLLL